jgi:cytochrome c-type biogenesis protein CcmE
VSDKDVLAPREVAPVPSRSRRRTVLVLVVLAVAVVALLSQGLLHSLNYFDTVDEVLAKKAAVGTTVIRLEGVVKPHTVHRTTRGASFWITGSGSHEVYVVDVGTPPQLFQDNIPVVVVGHFASASSDVFHGTEIIVKHSASYIAAHPARVKAPNGTTR